MVTTRIPSGSYVDAADPAAIRRLVQRGKDLGLIHPPGAPVRAAAPRAISAPVPDVPRGLAAVVESPAGAAAEWLDVTPACAAEWLKKVARNRHVSRDVVTAYARDMARGLWVATHQGIAFNDAGELIDGQHRLRAVIAAGRPVRMLVTRGLAAQVEGAEMTTMDAVDRGRPRSISDQLRIQHGFAHAPITAAICLSLGALCHGERTRRLSVAQTLEVYRAFEPEIAWLVVQRSKAHGLRAAGVLAAFAFALVTERGEDVSPRPIHARPVAALYVQLVGEAELAPGRPLRQLHDFLTSAEARLLTRGSDRGVAELALNALHLEHVSRWVDLLTLSPEGRDFFRARQADRVARIAAIFALPKAA